MLENKGTSFHSHSFPFDIVRYFTVKTYTIHSFRFFSHNKRKIGKEITMISYKPLWETMKKKDITQYKLLNSGIDNKLLDSLKHNRNITLNTLEKICTICDCTPNDVVQFIKEEPETQEVEK